MKVACVSSGMNARRTSDAVGKLTRSGILHSGFTPHTALSRTRRGSFPSTCTIAFAQMLSGLLDGHLCADDPSADTVSGSASAAFQLPMHSVSSLGKSACSLGGHCMLRGNLERAPAGTLGEGSSLMSGSSDAEASACSSDSLRLAIVGSQAGCGRLRTPATLACFVGRLQRAATRWMHGLLHARHQDFANGMLRWHASTHAKCPWKVLRR